MRVFNRFPEQASDRRGVAIVGLICLAIGGGFSLIDVLALSTTFIIAGTAFFGGALFLSQAAFEWIKRKILLFCI